MANEISGDAMPRPEGNLTFKIRITWLKEPFPENALLPTQGIIKELPIYFQLRMLYKVTIADNVPVKLAINIVAAAAQLNARNNLPVDIATSLPCPSPWVIR